jgi:1,4-dihydroxy-2-naphthoate octaprenyltransferase
MTTATTSLSRVEAWYRAARPRTLTATYVPLGLAAMLALQERVFQLVPFVLALIGALFLQIAANLINEYYDYRRGAEDLKQSGQGMVIKQGVLTPQAVLIGAVVTVLAGVAIGLYLLTQSGPLLFWIGLSGVLVVIAYTAGPFPLAYNGLGEVAVFIFMGPLMVLGAWYVMARDFSPLALWVGVPIGFTVAAILHANNIRDMESDRTVNKRTLALMLGLRGARIEYIVLMLGAYVAVVLMVIAGIMPWTVLIAVVTLPEALRLIRIVTTSTDNAQLHMAQGRTAKQHGALGLWLIIGWVIWLIATRLL